MGGRGYVGIPITTGGKGSGIVGGILGCDPGGTNTGAFGVPEFLKQLTASEVLLWAICPQADAEPL